MTDPTRALLREAIAPVSLLSGNGALTAARLVFVATPMCTVVSDLRVSG